MKRDNKKADPEDRFSIHLARWLCFFSKSVGRFINICERLTSFFSASVSLLRSLHEALAASFFAPVPPFLASPLHPSKIRLMQQHQLQRHQQIFFL